MPFHHVAIAAKDIKATHEFYTRAMGFELVKVEVGRAGRGGWAKHLFYDTGGGGLIAFWDLHDASLSPDWSPAIAEGLGLPVWTNHLAFDARDAADLEARRERWRDHGLDVMEIDHGWCRSIYAKDPNGILVEFCYEHARAHPRRPRAGRAASRRPPPRGRGSAAHAAPPAPLAGREADSRVGPPRSVLSESVKRRGHWAKSSEPSADSSSCRAEVTRTNASARR